jgi:hypothetical protein
MSQKSGPQLPVNSYAQRSKPGFGTVERFGRVVIAHDNVLYRLYKSKPTFRLCTKGNCRDSVATIEALP